MADVPDPGQSLGRLSVFLYFLGHTCRGPFTHPRCRHMLATPATTRVGVSIPEWVRHMAGVPGFEPGLSVLETDVLTIDTIPLHSSRAAEQPASLTRQAS